MHPASRARGRAAKTRPATKALLPPSACRKPRAASPPVRSPNHLAKHSTCRRDSSRSAGPARCRLRRSSRGTAAARARCPQWATCWAPSRRRARASPCMPHTRSRLLIECPSGSILASGARLTARSGQEDRRAAGKGAEARHGEGGWHKKRTGGGVGGTFRAYTTPHHASIAAGSGRARRAAAVSVGAGDEELVYGSSEGRRPRPTALLQRHGSIFAYQFGSTLI